MKKLIVQGSKIQLLEVNGEKYISLTDLAREFGDPSVLIANWMRKKILLNTWGFGRKFII